MSQETLNIYDLHRKEEVEESPFSETFQIVGGSTFKGVFDRSHFEENTDGGNNEQKRVFPRIMVNAMPSGLTERSTRITRENGVDTYTFRFFGVDDEGIPSIWLY